MFSNERLRGRKSPPSHSYRDRAATRVTWTGTPSAWESNKWPQSSPVLITTKQVSSVQIPELLVAGRTSSLNARKLGSRLPTIARALHVSYLLEGSIQRHSDDVRVHVSLIDEHNGFELWGQSYDGSLSDIFALQDEIAGSVSPELALALQLEPSPPGLRRTSPSQAALKLYLQGRALTMRAIGDGVLDHAVELLESAVELEPEFDAAWTALAEAYVYTTVYTPRLDRLEAAWEKYGWPDLLPQAELRG